MTNIVPDYFPEPDDRISTEVHGPSPDGKFRRYYYANRLVYDDGDMEVARVEGWAMCWHIFAEYSTGHGRYAVCYTFDGPVAAGAGAMILEFTIPMGKGGADQLVAWQTCMDHVNRDICRQIVQNVGV